MAAFLERLSEEWEKQSELVRRYNSHNYRRFSLVYWFSVLWVFLLVPLLLGTWSAIVAGWGWGSALAWCVWLAVAIALHRSGSRIIKAARSQSYSEERDKIAAGRQAAESLGEMLDHMKKVTDKIENLSRIRGDTIIRGNINVAGEGMVVIGSELVNSMNRNPEIADALKVVAGFVQDSGNDEAKKCLNELIKKNNAGEDKMVTGALWERLIKILPSVTNLADSFIKLTAFFAGAG